MTSYHQEPIEQDGWFEPRQYENTSCPTCGSHRLECKSIINRHQGTVTSQHRDRTSQSALKLTTRPLPTEFVIITFRCEDGHEFAQATSWTHGRRVDHVLTGCGIFKKESEDA